MGALPTALYADPEKVCANAETGDVVPVKRVKAGTCFECVNVRPGLYGPPCAIHCMPSAESGRCVRWGDHR